MAEFMYSSALNWRIGVLDFHMKAEANVADAACMLAGGGMVADRAPAWQCLWLLSFGVERRACERQVEFVIVPAEPPESYIAARSKLPANLFHYSAFNCITPKPLLRFVAFARIQQHRSPHGWLIRRGRPKYV